MARATGGSVLHRSVPGCGVSLSVAAVALVALLAAPQALAACDPAAPVSNTTVTCSGTTTNQNAPNGYGTYAETNLVINVLPGASVTGTNDGFGLNDASTVNNFGTITGQTFNGITSFPGGITVTNFGIISGADNGISSNGNANVTNFGSISGTNRGIDAATANVANSGIIRADGAFGVGISAATANVTNSGIISANGILGRGVSAPTVNLTSSGTIEANGAFGTGVFVDGTGTINNLGTISAAASTGTGIFASPGSTASVTNSGTISGGTGLLASAGGAGWSLTNSGTIIGTAGIAINFAASAGDTLTFLPGSRIIGLIGLGAGDRINIRTGSDIAWLLTFGAAGASGITATGSTVSVSGGGPFVLSGDRIATLDPTAFGLADRTLTDFTGNVSSLISSRFGEFASSERAGMGATAFAPTTNNVADAASVAFASIPALASAYASNNNRQGITPNATVVDRASGIAVWSQGFVGGRRQEADGSMLAATAIAYGGAIGVDRWIANGLRLGAFLGAGYSRLNIDLSQSIETDYAFSGVYGRFDWTSHFLDFALSTGRSTNASNRTVANNLTPNGLETATTSYNSWFVSPELAYGVRLPFAGNAVLIPTARLRYVAGHFNGYSEAGSGQNLTVAGRTVQNVEERLELALSHTDQVNLQGWLKTTVTLGVLGWQRLGDTTINTVLIGQNLLFTTPGRNSVGGAYSGVGLDYRATQRVSLFAAVEGTVMSDKSIAGTAKGGARATF